MIRVAVVDDHEMFRAGVIAAISNAVDVVGQAGDVEGSIAMIADTQPDVVLLDVHVPGGNGGGGNSYPLQSTITAEYFSCFISIRFSRRCGSCYSRGRSRLRHQSNWP